MRSLILEFSGAHGNLLSFAFLFPRDVGVFTKYPSLTPLLTETSALAASLITLATAIVILRAFAIALSDQNIY